MLADLLTARRPKKFNDQTFNQDSRMHKHPRLPVPPHRMRPWPQAVDHKELIFEPPPQAISDAWGSAGEWMHCAYSLRMVWLTAYKSSSEHI